MESNNYHIYPEISTAWVVDLTLRKRVDHKVKLLRQRLYVRARTRSGAIKTAKANSFMPGVRGASAQVRLATPHDLGAVEVQR